MIEGKKMNKVYFFVTLFAINLVAADIGAGEMKELYETLSKMMPQPISDFVSTFSLGLVGLPVLLLLSAPLLAVLYAVYKVVRKHLLTVGK